MVATQRSREAFLAVAAEATRSFTELELVELTRVFLAAAAARPQRGRLRPAAPRLLLAQR